MYSARAAFLEITVPGANMNIHQSVLGTGASLYAMYTNPSKCIPGELPGQTPVQNLGFPVMDIGRLQGGNVSEGGRYE